MNNKEAHNIMIIAGEISGDLHGASLITELKKIDSTINVYGIGGDKMISAGMQPAYHINRMAFLGFAEVIKHLPFIRRVKRDLLELTVKKNIKTVVLIDYPGFNLSIARELKKPGTKIIYYISPQVWAWGAGRIEKIKNLVNKILVILPFEEDIYHKAGVPVEFVGHPLLERIKEYNFLTREELNTKFGLDPSKEILLLLAGSRKHEVEKIFPQVIKAAARLAQDFNLQAVVACSSNIDEDFFHELTGIKGLTVIKGHTYDFMKHALLGIIKSGTSTLEAGLFALPMVVVYKTSLLTYLIGKNLVKLKNIGLVNIVAGETVVPELIQQDASSENIYKECSRMLSDKIYYSGIKKKLEIIKHKLGSIGASERAAKSIYTLMNEA
jgi:lipid-A-disaccharide synthase